VPTIKFGKISIDNVPAIVQPLGDYAPAFGGEAPGMMLGKQVMHAFGTIGFDFPASNVELAKAPPAAAADGEVELPMPFISTYTTHAPVIPLGIEGSDHRFFAYVGGLYPGTVAVAKKHYFKSGKLPRDVEAPEDPAAGLKMVYLSSVDVGPKKVTGVGGLVLVNEPADATLDHFLQNALFEIGGFVSVRMLKSWKVTYALQTGKVYIRV
jgi:hypothetical protein